MINLYNFGHVAKKGFTLKKVSTAIRILSLVSAGLFLTSAAFMIVMILTMGILPLKYLIALGVGCLVLFAIGIVMFFVSKKHKTPAIITSILLIIISALMCLGLGYLSKTKSFFGQTQAKEYYTENYSVVVLADASYANIHDLAGKTCASYFDTTQTYDQAFDEVKELIELNTDVKNTFVNAAFAVINKEADFAILSDSHIEILSDLVEDFKDKIKSIYTIEIKIYDAGLTADDVDVLNDSFNIYISGIDAKGPISTVSRSDVNMIVTVNPKTHKILLTSIPRDFYVQLHGTTGAKDKLTHSGIYGPKMTVKTVEDFMDISINYYVRVNFTSVINLVDAIGGIDIYSDVTFRAWTDHNCFFWAGNTSHEYGKCALAYARERHAYGTGDLRRIQNQQQVLTAIIDRILSAGLLSNYTNILSSIEGYLETNIPEKKFYQLINNQLDKMPHWTIESYAMEGYNSHNEVYSYDLPETGEYNNYYYVMEPNYETVEIAKEKIKKAFAGE